jgi:hypothetical protein
MIGEKTPAAQLLRKCLHDQLQLWMTVTQYDDKLYVFLDHASEIYHLPEVFQGLTVVPRVRGTSFGSD